MPLDVATFLRLTDTGGHSSSHASSSDWWRASPRAFGGQLVAHCIVAAGRRAPAGWSCHSAHVHFVGAGKMQSTEYQVTTLRQGRTLSLFHVKAVEADGSVVVVATVGFQDTASERQKGAQQLCTSTATPGVPPPPSRRPPPPPVDSSSPRRAAEWPARRQLNDNASLWWLGWPSPQRLGPLEQAATSPVATVIEAVTLCNRGCNPTCASSLWLACDMCPYAVQAAALAFLSDLRGAEIAAHAHRGARRVAMQTSLDHTLHFHSAAPQPLGWVLVQLESPWAADGRAVVRMRLWSPEGALLATAVQEAVLRTEPRLLPLGAPPAGEDETGSAVGVGYGQDGLLRNSSKL